MTKTKIYELAKELDMPSKDLLDKVVSMGIEAKTHMSSISEIDATSVKNTILRGKSGTETKIVKVAPKQHEETPKEEKKVVVKAATVVTAAPEAKRPPAQNKPTGQNKPSYNENKNRFTQGKTFEPNKNVEGERKEGERKIVLSKPAENSGTMEQNKTTPSENKPAFTPNTNKPTTTPNTNRPTSTPNANRPASTPNTNRPASTPNANRPTSTQNANRPAFTPNTNKPTDQARGNARPNEQRSNYNGQRPASPQNRQGGAATSGHQLRPNTNKATPDQKNKDQKPFNKDNRNNNSKTANKPYVKPVYDAAPLAQKQKSRSKAQRVKVVEVEPEINIEELEPGTKIINVPITVAGFADQIEKSTSAVIMSLMKMGVMANINQNLDEDMVVVIGAELGVPIIVGKVEEEIVEEGLDIHKDKDEELKSRSPIITVMGHVDHGKTSLLDAIRKTNVASAESGGITQHIGASEVSLKGQKIVFLDTPGHEAFTAMRARGAHATDIAVLVVAADDSVKPQTIESISHAKAAGVPIIVAMNKMDKPGANPDKVKQDLTEHGILIEEWGGDTICVPVSAKTGEGIVTLLEMILLQAEVLELKANPNRLAMGTVIEARLDNARGTVATLLVLNGTLKSGMSIVAGTCSGKIKAMHNHLGEIIRKAGPATAVEILGLSEVPQAGDEFHAVKEDRAAREIADNRKSKLREEVMARNSSTTLEQLFSQMEAGEVKDLNLIIKGDVQGSVGALTTSLEKLKNENIKVKIIYAGVGTVTESDIMLANTSGAIIIAFNVRPSTAVSTLADREGVEIRTYRVIYNVIEEVEAAMRGMLDPVFKEVVLGKIEVRETFKVPGIGIIAGAYVLEGKVERNAEIRLVRDGIVIHEGKISSLKRFKDDAKEVNHGYECGIGIENYNDLKESDIIEAFKMEEVERK